jgi:hypothetical protein
VVPPRILEKVMAQNRASLAPHSPANLNTQEAIVRECESHTFRTGNSSNLNTERQPKSANLNTEMHFRNTGVNQESEVYTYKDSCAASEPLAHQAPRECGN